MKTCKEVGIELCDGCQLSARHPAHKSFRCAITMYKPVVELASESMNEDDARFLLKQSVSVSRSPSHFREAIKQLCPQYLPDIDKILLLK